LERDDFLAMAACHAEYPALAFYNSGSCAGASQPHRHLQMVPLPFWTGARQMPLEAAWKLGPLPFRHRLARFDAARPGDLEAMADTWWDQYGRLADAEVPLGESVLPPYNLLWTDRWMLWVPRSAEKVAGISLNALAFAGAFLVKTKDQLNWLRTAGPLAALRAVSEPASAVD